MIHITHKIKDLKYPLEEEAEELARVINLLDEQGIAYELEPPEQITQ